MAQIITFLPILVVLLFVAWSVRLAARLTGVGEVGWKLCLSFALLLLAVAVLRSLSGLALSAHVHPWAALALGIAFSVLIGSWLFGRYVVDSGGNMLGWKAGAKLTAFSCLIVCAPAVIVVAIGTIVRG
jgi:hypothetical protein